MQREIVNLIQIKEFLTHELNSIVYGSIEIRKNKYIYVHYRDEGIYLTKYFGEYTDENIKLIKYNNFLAKEIKNTIREINKKLKLLNYKETSLSDKIKINIDFAKRHLVDTIYKQAVLEGISTTYINTENIIYGGKVNNMTSEDILKIINLKHAWEFILNENVITSQTNLSLLCEINKLVLESFYYTAGSLRNVPVKITGTNYEPFLPIESKVKEEINYIMNKKISIVDKAIELLLYVMKSQLFIDGNKRCAVIFCNHYLVKEGKGLIVIPDKLIKEFKNLLREYYEGKNISKIKNFLKEKCYISTVLRSEK